MARKGAAAVAILALVAAMAINVVLVVRVVDEQGAPKVILEDDPKIVELCKMWAKFGLCTRSEVRESCKASCAEPAEAVVQVGPVTGSGDDGNDNGQAGAVTGSGDDGSDNEGAGTVTGSEDDGSDNGQAPCLERFCCTQKLFARCGWGDCLGCTECRASYVGGDFDDCTNNGQADTVTGSVDDSSGNGPAGTVAESGDDGSESGPASTVTCVQPFCGAQGSNKCKWEDSCSGCKECA